MTPQTQLLLIFIGLSIFNVIIQTAKSIATIKCGKLGAALTNAIAYGVYTYVLIFMSADLPSWAKALITALANLIGVYLVKLFEERARKDKLWKVEATVEASNMARLAVALSAADISFNHLPCSNNHYIFNCYCPTQKQSIAVKQILDQFKAKYFVSETKIL